MPVHVNQVKSNGAQLMLLHDDDLVDTAEWVGGHIVGFTANISPSSIAELEKRLAEEELQSLLAGATNSDGVDLTLIDWLLRLSPSERLAVLESYSGIPYSQILGVFANHQAQVLVVGGVAAHFYGASYNTKDLDLVYSRTPQNLERVMAALSEMKTLFRDLAGRKILPTTTHLLTATPKLLLTKHGPLDLLGTLSMEEDNTGYESLVADATHFDLNGLPVQVLSLPRLIAVKERLKRPADLIVLPILRAALERFHSKGL